MLEFVDQVGGGLQGQACLARTANARESQQPHIGFGQSLLDCTNLILAADERRRLRRQVVRTRVEGLERREVGAEIGSDDLKDALRPDQVLQASLAHVAQHDIRREMVADQLLGRQRQEDLAAVPGRHQPCGAVQGGAVVVAVAQVRHASVEGHS